MTNPYHTKAYIDLKAVLILVVLCLLWGVNMATIKFSNKGLEPIFTAAFRSLGASVLMLLWMAYRKEPFFPKGLKIIHPLMVGLLFGIEFVFIYVAQRYTLASRSFVFLYTHPFWVALGARPFFDSRGSPDLAPYGRTVTGLSGFGFYFL
jgi:drug/metabolite transporter (DMT)-like permease